ARQDAWLLLGHLCQMDRATLLASALDELAPQHRRAFSALVQRRAAREPLAQILGSKEFWSLDFQISKEVLCPRPDSECLIEAALSRLKEGRNAQSWGGRILDMGTGSGCLLLALLSELPAASGLGLDISKRALSMARSNSQRLGLNRRAAWLCADWARALDGTFDLIISNPPYIKAGERNALAPEVKDFEPATALFAGDDGLEAYRAMAGDLRRLLARGGFVCLEIGLGQADAVSAILRQHRLETVDQKRDLAGIDRCLIAEHA
ncbi:MAG: peptide chain release factor N(5)-glutamine methyltransferase, partial [Pseudomonadota bacterium]